MTFDAVYVKIYITVRLHLHTQEFTSIDPVGNTTLKIHVIVLNVLHARPLLIHRFLICLNTTKNHRSL